MISVTVNGEKKNFQQPISVQELLEGLKIFPTHIAVALNSEVIPRSHFSTTLIQDGDEVDIIQPVGGG